MSGDDANGILRSSGLDLRVLTMSEAVELLGTRWVGGLNGIALSARSLNTPSPRVG